MVDPEGGSVNWDTIIDMYARDLCRTERGCKTMTKVGAYASPHYYSLGLRHPREFTLKI